MSEPDRPVKVEVVNNPDGDGCFTLILMGLIFVSLLAISDTLVKIEQLLRAQQASSAATAVEAPQPAAQRPPVELGYATPHWQDQPLSEVPPEGVPSKLHPVPWWQQLHPHYQPPVVEEMPTPRPVPPAGVPSKLHPVPWYKE